MFRDLYHAQGCGSSGKTWDWDPVDADYMASGSNTTAAAPDPGGGEGAGLRPTTAGAVASQRPQSSGWNLEAVPSLVMQ